MRGARDDLHLDFATARGLVLVTCNRRDFLRLHYDSMEAGREHAGIILIHQEIPPGERIRRLLIVASLAEPSDMSSRVEWLKDWRWQRLPPDLVLHIVWLVFPLRRP